MAEYIGKSAIYEKFAELECEAREKLIRTASGTSAYIRNSTWLSAFTMAKHIAADFPAADVAPVVYGRWVSPHWNNSNYCCNCSECGGEAMHKEYRWNSKGIYPICPNCGARMDGDADGSD